MQTTHRIAIRGNSMVIDEMYFRLDEMRSVDVIRQERPLLLFMVLIGAILGIGPGAACIWLYTSTDFVALPYATVLPYVAAAFFLAAAVALAGVLSVKRRYALRIGQPSGMTKTIVSSDRDELETIRLQIADVLKNE